MGVSSILSQCKVLSNGQVSSDDLVKIDSELYSIHQEGPMSFTDLAREGEVLYCEGDLSVDRLSDFSELHDEFVGIAIRGNLIANFIETSEEDPEVTLVVGGHVVCDTWINRGLTQVRGNVTCKRALAGYYNHGVFHVHGDLQSAFVFPEEHAMFFGGKVDVACLLEGHIESPNAELQVLSFAEAYRKFHADLVAKGGKSEEDIRALAEAGGGFYDLFDDDAFFYDHIRSDAKILAA